MLSVMGLMRPRRVPPFCTKDVTVIKKPVLVGVVMRLNFVWKWIATIKDVGLTLVGLYIFHRQLLNVCFTHL